MDLSSPKTNPNFPSQGGYSAFADATGPKKAAGIGSIVWIKTFLNRPKEKELVTFLRELAILVEARVPLVRALESIKKQKYSPGLIEMAGSFQKRVEGGSPLSEAMEEYSRYFSPLYINVTRAGEASGRLDKVLNYLADNREKRYELRRKIIGALIYPGVISISFLAVFIFLMVFVMPSLNKTLTESGTKLPWTTKLVIGTSEFLTGHWLVVFAFAVGIMIGMLYYLRTNEGRKQWDL
ncbi:MAG: type II secretion system F family protein, partial [Candidatus Moranbacteria bacterium]|nr:type II secretion system F family protein [Candidatus Moranbacteria bacterium]